MHTLTQRKLLGRLVAAALFAAGSQAALAQDAQPIRIGVVTPLSGTYAPIGAQVKMGLDLALAEINQGGGIMGRKVELLYEDEEANPQVAVQKAEKLFQQSKVDFLTGTVNSGATLAVGQVAERNDKLISTTVSFSDAITGDKCSPNVFRVNAKAGQQSVALAAWLAKEKPGSSLFLLGPDYEMGRSTVAAFKAAAQQRGVKPVGELFAPLDSKDYSSYFGQIRAAKPQVFYTSTAGNDTVRLFSQMAEYGMNKNVTMVGVSGAITAQNIKAIGKNAEGFVTGVGYSPEIDTPENKQFVEKFQKANKVLPDLYGADSYGVLYFYKAAVEKAQSTDTAKVRKAMEGLQWDTPQGRKTMRAADHQAIQDMYVVKIQDGEFSIVSKVDGKDAIDASVCKRW